MAIIRWSPYRSMALMNKELENLFEDFAAPWFGRKAGEQETAGMTWMPDVDLSESKDGYILKAELPGVAKEDVKVTMNEGVVTISGEKKMEKETKENNYHRSERVYGSFTRSFRLPSPIAGDKVKAEYQNGILTLTLPKTEAAKPKEIEIK